MRLIDSRRGALAASGTGEVGTGGGVLLVASVFLVVLVLAALIATGSPEAVVFAALSVLAVAGVFLIFGWLSGYVTLSETAAAAEFGRAVLADSDAAVQVCADGRILYANSASGRLFGANRGVEQFLAADPGAAEALYRLTNAAGAGRSHREDVRVRLSRAEEARWLRIEVRPYRPALAFEGRAAAAVWTTTDIEPDRRREAETAGRLVEQLAFFDGLPIGLLTVAAGGQVSQMNTHLSAWLGMKPDTQRASSALKDILAGDGPAFVANALRGGARTIEQFSGDLIREDGTAMPVDLICVPAVSADAEGTVVLLDRRGQSRPQVTSDHVSHILQSAPFGVATIDRSGQILSANGAFARLYPRSGQASNTIAARILGNADADCRKSVLAHVERAISGRIISAPIEVSAGPDAEHTCRLYAHPVADTGSDETAAVIYLIDTSEQRALERRFAQSQKMEAVGQLAGGIAHDFNNVLTVIIGLSDLLLQGRRVTDPGHADIMQIKQNANHAAGLVKQLLAFSRKQTLAPTVLALNDVIQDFGYTLNKYVGEKVDVKHVAGRDLWQVKADRVQLEQVLINLTVNARDAMPNGGRLAVRTRDVSERESMRLANLSVVPGEYVLIEVEDSGTGMPPEVAARIFEPFFTTKEVGKGTGFGLSTVYGIIKQTGGYIFVDSTLGKGTTFRIYLPRHIPDPADEVEEVKPAKKAEPSRDLTGTGRVLLVEDEDGVRSFAVRALQRQGYEVLEAASGAEALDLMRRETGRVDLVVSDVIMPEMDGPTMFNEMRKTNPDLKVIFVSGYPSDHFEKSLDPSADFAFLPKPFTLAQLATKVKEHMDA
jgi:two-component system cell cycle sensor histidine kinase/response regulator CckA